MDDYMRMSEKELKDAALKEKFFNDGSGQHGYGYRRIQALTAMAKRGIYPDGRFGDEECNLWSFLRMNLN